MGSRKASTSPSLQAAPEGNTTTDFATGPHCSSLLTITIYLMFPLLGGISLFMSEVQSKTSVLKKVALPKPFSRGRISDFRTQFLKSLISKVDGGEEESDHRAELLMFEQLTTAHLQCLLLGF